MAASGSAVKFYYVEEVAGDIPAVAPEFIPIRFNTSSLSRNVAQVESNEINQTRQRPPAKQGTYSTQGEISCELSDGSYDDLLAILMQQADWTANTLKVGSTVRTIAILKRHTDTGEDVIYRGCRLNTFAPAADIDARVLLTFGVIGTDAEPYTVPVDATFAAATTSEPMVTSVGSISEGGSPLAYATSHNFTLNNGMAAIFALGARAAYDVQNGVFTATGSLTAYRETGGLYAKFLNETATSISHQFSDGTNTLTFDFPNVIYTQADDAVPGPDAITNSFTYSAGYDGSAATTVTITRSA
ncbi:hypothetical protein CSC70_06305 [Pseudoxanthomonas kalamensis DSM 18571]|uniref:phage tail tube protein n=1 Tax=Pseudoxanthomonas kalamensis TaxID=289483 RepID=UPI00139149B0|nr:phage tail tube protein [Pseudoxanthomonas kalamensis]KAF1710302.1 hypothetical protein CSC70_06305 [Pseudoxanthomonas kalamensis DSM 18571]